jgi:hypothetical protein
LSFDIISFHIFSFEYQIKQHRGQSIDLTILPSCNDPARSKVQPDRARIASDVNDKERARGISDRLQGRGERSDLMDLSTEEQRRSLRLTNMYDSNTNRVDSSCYWRSYVGGTQRIGTAESRRISHERRFQRVCRLFHVRLVILHLPHLLIVHRSPNLPSTSPGLGVHTAITFTNHEHQLHATRFLAHPIRPQLELELQVLRTKLIWKQLCAMESTREKIHWIGSGVFVIEADEEE